jgi:hypothetical protein
MKLAANALYASAISLMVLVGTASMSVAAPGDNGQQGQQAPLPADIQKQINAAIASGNPQTLSDTITQLIAANPGLADKIVGYAAKRDPKDAPAIAVAAAKEIQALGGDPVGVTLAAIAAVESDINPAAGPGSGELTQSEGGTLVNQILDQVEGAVVLNTQELRQLGTNVHLDLANNEYVPPNVVLPPASPH